MALAVGMLVTMRIAWVRLRFRPRLCSMCLRLSMLLFRLRVVLLLLGRWSAFVLWLRFWFRLRSMDLRLSMLLFGLRIVGLLLWPWFVLRSWLSFRPAG